MISIGREILTVPNTLARMVAREGGWNLYGRPNFRVVWGWSRLAWEGGRFQDWDGETLIRSVVEYRHRPKYMDLDRFIVETWIPPTIYGPPERWRAVTHENVDGRMIEALGPFPAEGEYEHCFTIQGPAGQFAPLTVSACEWIIRRIRFSRLVHPVKRKAAIEHRESGKTREFDRDFDAIFDDARPAFHGQPMIGYRKTEAA